VNTSDDNFIQSSDEDDQGNVLAEEEMAKQEEYRKKHSKVTMALRNCKTDHMVETITTNDQTTHTVATTTRTNAQEMIAADHPQEIAPTPTRAAQVITTETVPHSTTTKRNTR
jgi:myo-inositol-1-phosphate synthase